MFFNISIVSLAQHILCIHVMMTLVAYQQEGQLAPTFYFNGWNSFKNAWLHTILEFDSFFEVCGFFLKNYKE